MPLISIKILSTSVISYQDFVNRPLFSIKILPKASSLRMRTCVLHQLRGRVSHLIRERGDELEIYCKSWPVREGKRPSRQALILDWERQTIRCPAEQEMPFQFGEKAVSPLTHPRVEPVCASFISPMTAMCERMHTSFQIVFCSSLRRVTRMDGSRRCVKSGSTKARRIMPD